MCIPEGRIRLTPSQRAMLLELMRCEEAGALEGAHVEGARRNIAGRLVDKGLVCIKVVGTQRKWEARALLTDAGRSCIAKSRGSLLVPSGLTVA